MQRYYLHLFNGVGLANDEEGVELADLSAARTMAVAAVRDIVSAEARLGVIDLRGRIEIATEAREVLATVAFADAVEVLRGKLN